MYTWQFYFCRDSNLADSMTALRLQRAARPPIHCELRLQGEEVKTRQLQDAPASPTQRVQTSNQASRSRQKPSAVNQLRNPLLRPQLDSRLICLLFRSGRKKLPHARYPTHSPDRRTCPRRRSGGDFSAQNANQVLPLLFPPSLHSRPLRFLFLCPSSLQVSASSGTGSSPQDIPKPQL